MDMKRVEVASLGLDKASNTPVVILREEGGERLLPIWIGPGEASAIAMEMAGVKFPRPLTHDLFASVVQGLGSQLVRVMVTRVEDNTYYATLVLEKDGEVISVDARPSDSIALALRAEAAIYADDSLLARTTLRVDEAELGEAKHWQQPPEGGPEEGEGEEKEPSEPLREHLKRMKPEDFGRFTP